MSPKNFLILLLWSTLILFLTCPSYGQGGTLREAEELEQGVLRLYKQGRYSQAIPCRKIRKAELHWYEAHGIGRTKI